jgi:acyl carrier protein
MNKFHEGIAEILEVEYADITSQYVLTSGEADWDSLAIVSTIALADDCFNVMLDGKALAACETVADIEALVEAAKNA